MFTIQYSQVFVLAWTLFFFLSLSSNFDALSFWSELGQPSQVLILLFRLKSVVKMFIYLPDIRIKNSYNYKRSYLSKYVFSVKKTEW